MKKIVLLMCLVLSFYAVQSEAVTDKPMLTPVDGDGCGIMVSAISKGRDTLAYSGSAGFLHELKVVVDGKELLLKRVSPAIQDMDREMDHPPDGKLNLIYIVLDSRRKEPMGQGFW